VTRESQDRIGDRRTPRPTGARSRVRLWHFAVLIAVIALMLAVGRNFAPGFWKVLPALATLVMVMLGSVFLFVVVGAWLVNRIWKNLQRLSAGRGDFVEAAADHAGSVIAFGILLVFGLAGTFVGWQAFGVLIQLVIRFWH